MRPALAPADGPVVEPEGHRPGLVQRDVKPANILLVVGRALAKDPADRRATAAEFPAICSRRGAAGHLDVTPRSRTPLAAGNASTESPGDTARFAARPSGP